MNEEGCNICDHRLVCYLRKVVSVDDVGLREFCKFFKKADPDLKPIEGHVK